MKKAAFVLAISLFTAVTFSQADTTTLTKPGDYAPVFSCKTIDGKVLDISKMKGKVILLNFFATWCPPCNLELPVLQKNIWDKYKGKSDFVLVILGREHTDAEVAEFVKKKGFTMPFAADPERVIFSKYATQSIPRNVVIGRDGKILYQSIGYSPEEFKKLEELIAGQVK